jgi:large subunit ribosomal protein L31
MKDGIHPKYVAAKITCASCGNIIETKSTKGDIQVEICSNCHPFYTDKAKLMSATGRVEKFKKKYKMK